eukprot:SAG31_NODE_11558_length_1018_cov_0.896627_1_plen_45_part_10
MDSLSPLANCRQRLILAVHYIRAIGSRAATVKMRRSQAQKLLSEL